jgi:hypothetical protein
MGVGGASSSLEALVEAAAADPWPHGGAAGDECRKQTDRKNLRNQHEVETKA